MKIILTVTNRIFLNSILFLCCLSLNAHAQGDPPALKPGLQINRDELISKTTEFNTSLVFKQIQEDKGSPNFRATNTNGSTVELTGKANELTMAKWTFIATDDKKNNETELQRMQWFCMNLGGPEGWEWYAKAISAINKADNKSYSNEKLFNHNRQGKFQYLPQEKSYVIIFTPW